MNPQQIRFLDNPTPRTRRTIRQRDTRLARHPAKPASLPKTRICITRLIVEDLHVARPVRWTGLPLSWQLAAEEL